MDWLEEPEPSDYDLVEDDMDTWHRVDKEAPDTTGLYLVYYGEMWSMGVASFVYGEGWNDPNITHWMDLPDAPEDNVVAPDENGEFDDLPF